MTTIEDQIVQLTFQGYAPAQVANILHASAT
jgi:hypothetical protein